MGNLTVYFAGICTHLREFTSRDAEHRVVLLNARDEREINRETIVGHEARLCYEDIHGVPQIEPLNGVHITVTNVKASTPEVVYAPSFFNCIPRLTRYAPRLPSLSLAVAKDRLPNLVSAYFDAAGRFIAGVEPNSGASVAVLDVITNDENPKLKLEPFVRNPGDEIKEITLPLNARIQIENVGPGVREENGDQRHDFLLHFLVAQGIPTDATWPQERTNCLPIDLPFHSNTVDPGCSNSNYP